MQPYKRLHNIVAVLDAACGIVDGMRLSIGLVCSLSIHQHCASRRLNTKSVPNGTNQPRLRGQRSRLGSMARSWGSISSTVHSHQVHELVLLTGHIPSSVRVRIVTRKLYRNVARVALTHPRITVDAPCRTVRCNQPRLIRHSRHRLNCETEHQ